MTAKLFESALGIADPWGVESVEFDEEAKTLTALVNFKVGSRFAVTGHEGLHRVHDTVVKAYRHMNFFPTRMPPASAHTACDAAQRLGSIGRT